MSTSPKRGDMVGQLSWETPIVSIDRCWAGQGWLAGHQGTRQEKRRRGFLTGCVLLRTETGRLWWRGDRYAHSGAVWNGRYGITALQQCGISPATDLSKDHRVSRACDRPATGLASVVYRLSSVVCRLAFVCLPCAPCVEVSFKFFSGCHSGIALVGKSVGVVIVHQGSI